MFPLPVRVASEGLIRFIDLIGIPAPKNKNTSHHSLFTRWREYCLVGMNLLHFTTVSTQNESPRTPWSAGQGTCEDSRLTSCSCNSSSATFLSNAFSMAFHKNIDHLMIFFQILSQLQQRKNKPQISMDFICVVSATATSCNQKKGHSRVGDAVIWQLTYLVVEPTHLKHISQNWLFPQIGVNIKNIFTFHCFEPAAGILGVNI